MVNFIPTVALATTALFSCTIAAPNNITGALTFPFVHGDLTGQVDGRKCIDCRELCDSAESSHAIPAEKEACQTVCDGQKYDECEWLSEEEQGAYLTAYYGPNWLQIPGLLETWSRFNGDGLSDRKRAVSQPAATAANTTIHHLEARKSTKVNCKALCSPDSSVSNDCACDAVCHHSKNKNDCKEQIHTMKKLHKLTKCFFPGDSEALYQECSNDKHRHKCFQKLFDDRWSDMTGHKTSHDC